MSKKPMQTNNPKSMLTVHTEPNRRRLHINLQSKGNVGKSLETEMRVAWLDARGIPWRGSDLDDRHKTFFNKHPSDVRLHKIGNNREANETLQAIFRGIFRQESDVHVIDTRAQMDELFVNAIEDYDYFGLCREEGIRVTQIMFPTDELASMNNFTNLVLFSAGAVDYLVINNPAKNKGKLYHGSALANTMQELGAKIINMPTINYATLRVMEIAEHNAKRGIPLAEFASEEAGHLDVFMRREIQSVLSKMYRQYDKVADVLLPTIHAASIQALDKTVEKEKKPQINNEGYQLNFNEP